MKMNLEKADTTVWTAISVTLWKKKKIKTSYRNNCEHKHDQCSIPGTSGVFVFAATFQMSLDVLMAHLYNSCLSS